MTRSIDRLLAGLLVAVLVVAAVGSLPGFYLVGSDLQTTGEFLDGLGVVFGLLVLGLVVVPAVVAALALRAVRQGRPTARRWSIAAGLLGAVAVLPFGFYYQPVFTVLVVPALLTFVAANTEPAV